MSEIDFVTLGIKPNGELLRRAAKVLSELPEIDELNYRSAPRASSPMKAAYDLLNHYVIGQKGIFKKYRIDAETWYVRRLVRAFMEIGLPRQLQNVLLFRDQIVDAVSVSEIYTVTLDIIHEYEFYCSQKIEINKHVEAQRKILDSRRKDFLTALEKRDGLFCKACGTFENLCIDHITPLSFGGFSVLENLQLLCRFCNNSKGDRPMDYLYQRMKLRKPVIK